MPGEMDMYYHACNSKWHEVKNRVTANPIEAQYLGCFGRTALHEACRGDPPAEVITSILDAFPEGASLQDKWLHTPLHIASITSSPEVVGKLLEHDSSIIFKKNKFNRTPLEHLCACNEVTIKGILNKSLLPGQIPSEIFVQNRKFQRVWNNICLLIKSACLNCMDEYLPGVGDFRIVHACAGMKDCPNRVMQLAIKFHPEQLKQVDKEGKLPLHLAISNGKTWENGIEAILSAYPAALVSKDIDERFYPRLFAFIARGSSLSSLFGVLREVPQLMAQ